MGEFNAPKTLAEFEQNFAQIKPGMTANQAHYESSRCLFCYDAPCVAACPTEIDIPLFIKQIHSGNVNGAARTIFESNYFGHSCGKVCPTEVLCEGACVYNHQSVKPIEIGRLQSFATHEAIKGKKFFFGPGAETGKHIAIVGAGPSGLACAAELRKMGHQVTIFEAKSMPSGLTVHGIAPYKITNEEVLEEMDWLQSQFGFQVNYNHAIDSAERAQSLLANYDAVFLGIGLGGTATLGIAGEDLPQVVGAVEFVEWLRTDPLTCPVSGKVVVIGGGNTAMDAASEAARMGAEEVTLVYRKRKADMSAYFFEFDLAKSVGVKALFQLSPLEILGNGRVSGIRFQKTNLINGRWETIPEAEEQLDCDWVIKATGQGINHPLWQWIPGLVKNGSKIEADATGRTGNPKVFVGGDALSGGKEVVNAVAEGKKAAQSISAYLASKN